MFSLFMQIISTAILMTRSVPEVDYKSQKVLRSKSNSNHLEISNFILSAFFISWISPTPSAWVRRGTPGSAWPPGSVSPDQAGTNIYHIYQICLLVKKLFFGNFPCKYSLLCDQDRSLAPALRGSAPAASCTVTSAGEPWSTTTPTSGRRLLF